MSNAEIKLEGPALALLKGGIAKAAKRAAKKAASTSARNMTSEAVKIIREKKALKVKSIKKAVKIKRNKARRIDDMSWGVTVTAKPTRLMEYSNVRWSKRNGVSATIDKGKRVRIKSAFIATMASGRKGVFKRKGKGRLPIKELQATRAFDVLKTQGSIDRLQSRGMASYKKAFDRLLPVELEKV